MIVYSSPWYLISVPPYLENITLDTVDINANSYIGGLTGRANYNISNIDANNINITATGNYVGGILGYSNVSGSGYFRKEFINIINSNVTSEGNYVGGIIGHSVGSVSNILTNSYVSNTNISGHNYVGGMAGYKYQTSAYNSYNNTVENCYIYGSGEYIGGLNGWNYGYEYYALVNNCGIYGTSVDSDYVGGIIGCHGLAIYSCKITDSEVISKGDSVGGVVGVSQSFGHGPRYCYVENTTVEGRSKVGGITGEIQTGDLLYGSVNAKVIATSHTAGGLIGFMDNTNTSAIVNVIRIWDNSVNDITVISPTKARRTDRRHSKRYR